MFVMAARSNGTYIEESVCKPNIYKREYNTHAYARIPIHTREHFSITHLAIDHPIDHQTIHSILARHGFFVCHTHMLLYT